jgi:hypothetical protein
MAIEFVVEDGTGLTNSTTYIDEAFFIQYWENRGIAYTSSDTLKIILNRATQYLDDNYCFKGARVVVGQSLQFPRGLTNGCPPVTLGSNTSSFGNIFDGRTDNYIETNEIPISLKNALAELGNVASTETDLYGTNKGITSLQLGPAEKMLNGFGASGGRSYRSVSKYLSGLVDNMVRV